MKKIFKTKNVTDFNKKQEIEDSLKKLWKQYHLLSGKEKNILKKYLDELEKQLLSFKKEKPILLVADIETGEKLSNYIGNETFIILLKSKYKQIEANDNKKRIVVHGNNSIYTGPNTLTHRQLIHNIISHLAMQKFSSQELEKYSTLLNNFAKDIMDSKHYFAGRYDSSTQIAYIWDFPNEDIIKTLRNKYPAIKEIRY